jgi:hypothetical protein
MAEGGTIVGVPRPTVLVWTLLALVVAAVALEPLSETASLVAAAVAAAALLAVVLDGLGHGEADLLDRDVRSPARVAERRRSALARLKGERDWDRRCPDAPDEPVDEIWARERRRRALG